MKRYIFSALVLLGTCSFAGNDNEKKVKHDIKEVTVFLAGGLFTKKDA